MTALKLAQVEIFKPEIIEAKPSPGPITPAGKARSSMNALKHGALSEVLPVTERKEYAEHVQAVRDDYNPVGYIEERLTDRIASSLWRLRRMERYESSNITLTSALAVGKMYELKPDYGRSSKPGTAGLYAKPDYREAQVIKDDLKKINASLEIHLLGADRVMLEPGAKLLAWLNGFWELAHTQFSDGLWGNPLWKKAERKLERELKANGWKNAESWEEESEPFLTFDLASDAIHALARVLIWNEKLEPLRECWAWAGDRLKDRAKVLEHELHTVVSMEAFTFAVSGMPDLENAEKLARYETHLERGLYRAMHELEAMQDRRKGKAAPLARVQVHGDDG